MSAQQTEPNPTCICRWSSQNTGTSLLLAHRGILLRAMQLIWLWLWATVVFVDQAAGYEVERSPKNVVPVAAKRAIDENLYAMYVLETMHSRFPEQTGNQDRDGLTKRLREYRSDVARHQIFLKEQQLDTAIVLLMEIRSGRGFVPGVLWRNSAESLEDPKIKSHMTSSATKLNRH